MTTLIKICGIKYLEDALDAIELGADYLGFVFNPESPWFLNPEDCAKILEDIPYTIQKVGVFSDADPQFLIDVATALNLDMLQLDGNESAEYCNALARPFLKRFHPNRSEDLEALRSFDSDFFLIESVVQTAAQGFISNWDLAREAKKIGKIFLSGALSEKNVEFAIQTVKPFAVNVCEGIEISPGKKDYSKMQEFVRRVQNL